MARRARTELTPAKAKRLFGVAKVVAPLLAPYAMAAAGGVRQRWDVRRARRLGVTPEQLGSHTGRGGALRARLGAIAMTLAELREASEGQTSQAAQRFAVATEPRLGDLASAIRVAEQMPASRRRVAQKAISGELDRIEQQLLKYLGIQS
jgi:hypothetical protein